MMAPQLPSPMGGAGAGGVGPTTSNPHTSHLVTVPWRAFLTKEAICFKENLPEEVLVS